LLEPGSDREDHDATESSEKQPVTKRDNGVRVIPITNYMANGYII